MEAMKSLFVEEGEVTREELYRRCVDLISHDESTSLDELVGGPLTLAQFREIREESPSLAETIWDLLDEHDWEYDSPVRERWSSLDLDEIPGILDPEEKEDWEDEDWEDEEREN